MSFISEQRARLRKLVAELDERAGAALEILNDLSAEDVTMVEDETLLASLEDVQAVVSDWQEAKGYI